MKAANRSLPGRLTTDPRPRSVASVHRARTARRAGLVLLAAFVAAGATGLLGTRTVTARASGGGYQLIVTYPAVSRPGHAVRWQAEVRHTGGFRGPVTLRRATTYFDLFDENGFDPQPIGSTQTAGDTIEQYAPPPGEVLVVSSDTRIEPDRQRGEAGEVAVVESGRDVVVVRFRTWIAP